MNVEEFVGIGFVYFNKFFLKLYENFCYGMIIVKNFYIR